MAAEPAESKGTLVKRTAKAVIDDAIRETAGYDALCWWGLVVFGLTGVLTIFASVWQGNAGIGAVGTVPTVLCWPAIRYAIRIRQGNVALRMLELALDKAKSSEQALQAINQAFGFHFGDSEVGTNVVQKPKAKAPRSGS